MKLFKSKKGASGFEYAGVAALVAVATIVGVYGIGSGSSSSFAVSNSELEGALMSSSFDSEQPIDEASSGNGSVLSASGVAAITSLLAAAFLPNSHPRDLDKEQGNENY